MSIEEIFNARANNRLYNTSYPLKPSDWSNFRTSSPLDFSGMKELSFYLHIPFCEHLCAFCEYTRTICRSETMQHSYLLSVNSDINKFIARYSDVTLLGFDIGGGTPTALTESNFCFLMDIYQKILSKLAVSIDFEPSIEATFQSITTTKLQAIAAAGIKRISFGLQSADQSVQAANHRVNSSIERAAELIDQTHKAGINKVNIDLMYGLKEQTLASLECDLLAIQILNPEQVTLYEYRTNLLNTQEYMSKTELAYCYNLLYKALLRQGYFALYGQNTFSKNPNDKGLSSYLRHRMIDFMPYKGFGISAQSMSPQGISYNIGKGYKNLMPLLSLPSFMEQDSYTLPDRELMNKYISVSGYYGRFSISKIEEIAGINFRSTFKYQLAFCVSNGLLVQEGDNLSITPKGFINYGAVLSLFTNLA